MRSGTFLRLLLPAALAAGMLMLGPAEAATPSFGTIGTSNASVSWTGQFYAVQATPLPDACAPVDPLNTTCDHFSLSVDVPPSYWDTNTGGADIEIHWPSSDNDFDLYVYDNTGTLVGQSASGGTTSERFLLQSANSAQSPYDVRIVPFLVVASGYDGSATFVSQPGGPTNPPRSTGGLAFSGPATVVDPQRTEGEPINWLDRNNNYWESGPWGVSTQQSFIHRSVDGGNQFNIVSPVGLRPEEGPGGGDTDIVTDDQGNAYFVDLESLLNLACAVSNDNGNNWRRNSACVNTTADDRQWFAIDNGTTSAATDNTVFLGYREELGTHIYSSPGSTGSTDPIGGVLYTDSSDDVLHMPLSAEPRCGQLRFDPVLRNLYYPCSADNHVEMTVGHVAPGQRTGIHYENVELPMSPGGGGVDDLFPVVATDAAGNVYVAWTDTLDNNVYYSASTDQGVTWTTPRQVSGNDSSSTVMPWIQAGAAGNVVVTWYGTSSNQDSDFMPSWYNNRNASTAFKWYGYVALITGAQGAAPSYYQQRFTDQPMHYGQICTGGIGCTISGGDRTMADYFSVFLDRSDGAMRFVYNDTTSQHHGAHVFEVRQIAGPSATGGTINRSIARNPVSDPEGDAQSPHYSPGGTGSNLRQFDFNRLRLSQPNASTLRVEMTLNRLNTFAPPTGKANSLWLSRFQALSEGDEGEEAYRIFYVGAESVNGGSPTFFAGSGDSNNNGVPGDGCVNTTPENCKIVQYPNEVAATGSVSGNVITIDVPISGGFGPGRPILGSTLYNVTALSAGRNNSSTDIYADLDATRAFDFAVGGIIPPPENPCKVTGGGSVTASPSSEGRFSLSVNGTKGKVDYRDDGPAGANFRSKRVLQTSCTSNTARIEGEGTNNGHAVTFVVNVVDNGEAGTTDTFSIAISDNPPYSRSGTLIRGNIQIHNN
jgi:hypothetical protein